MIVFVMLCRLNNGDFSQFESGRTIPDELIQNVIDYIVASDAEFMTFSQAKEIKRNIVSIGDYEDTNNHFVVGRDGTILNL